LTKAFKGGFKDTELDMLMYLILQKVAEKATIDLNLIEDVCCGNVCISQSAIDIANREHTRSPMAKQHTNSEPHPSQQVSQTPPAPPP
jgi:hypothetical protein